MRWRRSRRAGGKASSGAAAAAQAAGSGQRAGSGEKGGQREEPEVESLARSLQGTRIALGEGGGGQRENMAWRFL